jgi:hypothetical protein
MKTIHNQTCEKIYSNLSKYTKNDCTKKGIHNIQKQQPGAKINKIIRVLNSMNNIFCFTL